MTTRIKMGAVLVGLVTGWFLILIVVVSIFGGLYASGFGFASATRTLNKTASMLAHIAFFSIVFATFFVGGYVAGRMAALSGILNGAMVIITSALFFFLGYIFLSIVDQKLGINFIETLKEIISRFSLNIALTALFATAGSILGGKLGEGYIYRLNDVLTEVQTKEDKDGDIDKTQLKTTIGENHTGH